MTSAAVERLQGLDLGALNAHQLRAELARAIDEFGAEMAQAEAAGREMQAKLAQANMTNVALVQRLAREAEEKRFAPTPPVPARPPGVVVGRRVVASPGSAGIGGTFGTMAAAEPEANVRASSGPFDEVTVAGGFDPDRLAAGFPDDLPRIDRIEAEIGQLKALRLQTEELRTLVEALRAREEAPPVRDIPVLDTAAIFTAVAASLAEAQVKLPEGFALGAVEAEVKGAMGAADGRVVMGLDAQSAPAAGAISTLRFSVVPAPRTALLD